MGSTIALWYKLTTPLEKECLSLNPQDQSAVRIVAQMDGLFAIDAQARQERLSQEDRQLLRLEKFKPLARS